MFFLVTKKIIKNKLNKLPLTIFFKNQKNEVFFLRKTRLFVKTRYSRNRQWSKSIVYFGLWFNIVSIYVMFHMCYKYTFIFSYTWWAAAMVILFAATRSLSPQKFKFNWFIKHLGW